MKRWLVGALAAALVCASAAAAATDSSKLRAHVRAEHIMGHLQALQDIADAHDGTRASGTSGYQASVDYVVGQMRDAGYQVSVQPFPFSFFQELAPAQLAQVAPTPQTFINGTDFHTMTFSGGGDVTAAVQAVDTTATPSLTNTSGCEAADFAGFVPGRIALIQRGTCTFGVKAQNALAAGASGVLIFNNGTEGRTAAVSGTLGAPVALPVVGTSFALGQSLFALGTSAVVHMVVQTLSETRETYNVIADTPGGNPNRIVTIGAHLDSVIDGPGIVDNGSGVGTLIEIARSLNQVAHINPTGDVRGNIRNKVRFFFWGAEELSLLGSAFYVQSLSPAEKAKIVLNLNADMIASSNGIRFVFDGNASHTPPPATPLPQPLTAQIEQVFLDHFAAEGLATEPRQLDGRSDYQSFLAAGIPAGGLSAGSDQIKTAAQAAIYGGVPGPVHPCYHLACDRIDQTNVPLLEQMADAYAHAVLWFAMDGQALKKDG